VKKVKVEADKYNCRGFSAKWPEGDVEIPAISVTIIMGRSGEGFRTRI